MRFFKRFNQKITVQADDLAKRPWTVDGNPVKLVAIQKSRRVLRKGKTKYIYLINDRIYYNQTQHVGFFSRFGIPLNRVLNVRRFTNPTVLDKQWLKLNDYHVLGENKSETEKLVRCCLLKPDENNPYHAQFEFQDENGNPITQTDDVTDISRWPNKWPDGIITYRNKSYSDDLHSKIQDRVLTVALRAIGLRTKNIKFMRVYDEAIDPDLEIIFDSNHPLFKENTRALAFAYLPTNNPRTSRFSGLIIFSDKYDWDVYGKGGKQSLLRTLMHELLHALGFKHNERDLKSILYPVAILKNIVFVASDLDGIWKKYGKRIIPERIINYFIDRRIRGYEFDRLS